MSNSEIHIDQDHNLFDDQSKRISDNVGNFNSSAFLFSFCVDEFEADLFWISDDMREGSEKKCLPCRTNENIKANGKARREERE